VRQWEAKSGRAIGEPLRGHQGGVLSAAYSADGSRIVSAGEDGTVRQWEAKSGRAIGEPLRGHQGGVWTAAYSADGSRIVSAGEDGTVRQWLPAWSDPIRVACRSLRTNQSLLSPTTETEKEAKSTCQRWGWR
jgi:WD40 repeat protein